MPGLKLDRMRITLVLLPLAAVIAIGAVVFAVSLRDLEDLSEGTGPGPGAVDSGTPGAASERLPSQASVCQGVLRLPDPSAPRTFPGVYTQRKEAAGLSIVAPAGVSARALELAQQTVQDVFAGNDLEKEPAAAGAYVVIAAASQGILDLPEFGCLQGSPATSIYDRACGVADRADYPIVTVNELDLLGDPGGPCEGLNILYHELGHLVQNWSISPQDYYDIRIAYQSALDAGKYSRAYAATNPNEYFAEATQAYFLSVQAGSTYGREWLAGYDPTVFEIADRLYSGR